MTTVPFTYLIGWSEQDKWYYGARFAEGASPNDLWTSYFTSSRRVEDMRVTFGEPDIIQVRKVLNNKDETLTWEHRVLKRLNAAQNERWLNASNGSANFFHACSHTEESKLKMREAAKQRPSRGPMPTHVKEALRISKIGIKRTDTAERNRLGPSEQTKRKMSATRLNNPNRHELASQAGKKSAEARKADPTYSTLQSERIKQVWIKRKQQCL